MNFLFIEPFCSGSHALFAHGLAAHSTHHIDIIHMPGENFRWRMLGSALYMADHTAHIEQYDGLIVSDMLNLADFKSLVGPKCPPVMIYFHENQLTYPQPAGDKSVLMLGMINITSALSADIVAFNSKMHRKRFLSAIPPFLQRSPDFMPRGVAEKIQNKSIVLYPGISTDPLSPGQHQKHVDPPLIIWNHRWGYDKNYKMLFEVLEAVQNKGVDFQLALLGENYGKVPDEFNAAKQMFGAKILQFGYVPDRNDYLKWLNRGAIVISTADQENFGMSVIEAMILGCLPLLPNKLAYPEILPEKFHDQFLYKSKYDLSEKLAHMIANATAYQDEAKSLANDLYPFLWKNSITRFDRVLERLNAIKKS